MYKRLYSESRVIQCTHGYAVVNSSYTVYKRLYSGYTVDIQCINGYTVVIQWLHRSCTPMATYM